MWKTLSEAEEWYYRAVYWYLDLKSRQVTLNQDELNDEFIEIETDYANGYASFVVLDKSIMNLKLGKGGKYVEDDTYVNLKSLLSSDDTYIKIKLEMDISECIKYNDTMVVPNECTSLEFFNKETSQCLDMENNFGLVLLNQNVNIVCGRSHNDIKYLSKLYVLDKSISKTFDDIYTSTKSRFYKMHIKDVFNDSTTQVVQFCYINNLRVTSQTLFYNYMDCMVEKATVYDFVDLSDMEKGAGKVTLEKIRLRLHDLHSCLDMKSLITNTYMLKHLLKKRIDERKSIECDLSGDRVIVYVSDTNDNLGLSNYFDLLLDVYISHLCDYYGLDSSKMMVLDEKNKILSYTYQEGLNLLFVYSRLSFYQLYDYMIEEERKKI